MNPRGSILITTLWAMSFFSIMTASLTFGASQHVLMMKRETQIFRDKMDFMSVFDGICSEIDADLYPHEDSSEDSWFGKNDLRRPFDKRVEAFVEDEESKINMNEASENLLKAFFKSLEDEGGPLKGNSKSYIKTILKMRSHKKIQSMEELLLTEDFENEDYQTLLSYMTVYPDHSLVNINTAKRPVLKSLIQAIPGDHGTKLLLIGKLTEACGQEAAENRCYFLSRELTPEAFMGKLHLPQTGFMPVLVQEFLSKITTDSETFHLVMKTKSQRKADMIFRFRSGQLRPEVFNWHEI